VNSAGLRLWRVSATLSSLLIRWQDYLHERRGRGINWLTLREASQKSVKEVFNIVNEHTRLEVENPVAKVMEKGLIVGLANHTILIRKNSTEVPIDDSGAPIKDTEGKTTGVVLVFRDITRRKQAEEALRKAHDELELRVQERTAELEEANGALQAEIAERKRAEVQIREQATLLDKAQDAVAFEIWKIISHTGIRALSNLWLDC